MAHLRRRGIRVPDPWLHEPGARQEEGLSASFEMTRIHKNSILIQKHGNTVRADGMRVDAHVPGKNANLEDSKAGTKA